jgi:hypothetical protein
MTAPSEVRRNRVKLSTYTSVAFAMMRFSMLKGSLKRDFLLQVFFSYSVLPQTPEYIMGAILDFTKIPRDIRKLRLITGANNTSNK